MQLLRDESIRRRRPRGSGRAALDVVSLRGGPRRAGGCRTGLCPGVAGGGCVFVREQLREAELARLAAVPPGL